MKKIIAVIAILALICCLCSAVNAAEDGEDVDISLSSVQTMFSAEESFEAEESLESTASLSETVEKINPDTNKNEAATEEYSGGFLNMLDWLWSKAQKHFFKIATIILGALGALSYILQKTNLIPFITSFTKDTKDSVGGIKNAVDDCKEEIEKRFKEVKDEVYNITTNVEKALEMCNEARKQVAGMLALQKETASDRAALMLILNNQSEMFNTIVQASTLSQFKKEKIEEKYETNKKTIETMAKNITEEGEENV